MWVQGGYAWVLGGYLGGWISISGGWVVQVGGEGGLADFGNAKILPFWLY